ncbi:MAG: D-alanine--D-alanine ligase [Spirochaetaceae bacterium]
MKRRIRVAVLFGGRSAEHEVSLQSARNVMNVLDPEKFDIVPIGIDRTGRWFLDNNAAGMLDGDGNERRGISESSREVTLAPAGENRELIDVSSRTSLGSVDVIFPVLHGPFGEDGSIQGLAKLANLPCVGSGILGSAAGMDKDVMKRLLRDASLPIVDFTVYRTEEAAAAGYEAVVERLGKTLFVKPANMGSSVGISRAHDRAGYEEAVHLAFQFDTKIIVEREIRGREFEVSVLGNESPVASLPGEVVPHGGFYSYEAKYVDENGAALVIPAEVLPTIAETLTRMAVESFQALECRGMARVDFLTDADGHVFVNEVNTIPGFTAISMYPKLWEVSGIPYPELVERLISLAQEEFQRTRRLRIDPNVDGS